MENLDTKDKHDVLDKKIEYEKSRDDIVYGNMIQTQRTIQSTYELIDVYSGCENYDDLKKVLKIQKGNAIKLQECIKDLLKIAEKRFE